MIPVFRRFGLQDYPAAPEWLERFFTPLNTFCETTVESFTRNLTVGENIQGQKFTTTFSTPADYATGGFPLMSFRYTGGGQPNCLLLGQVSDMSNSPTAVRRRRTPEILTSPAISDWELDLNTTPSTLNVFYIAGLKPLTKYNVTMLLI